MTVRLKRALAWILREVAEDWWYERKFRELDVEHRQAEEALPSKGSQRLEDIRSLEREHAHDRRELHWEREVRFTGRLVREARRHRVHVPLSRVYRDGAWTTTEEWDEGPFPWEAPYLNAKGVKLVRDAIRDEKRWRIEKRNAWLPFAAAATGLVGAATGLAAILGGF